MKNLIFVLIIVSSTLFIGCSKDPEKVSMELSPGQDKMTAICGKWNLKMYNVNANEENHYFTGDGISTHALRSLTFHENKSYTSANYDWSGTFDFSEDSTKIILTPTNFDLIQITLSIDLLSSKWVELSSPRVNVNPVNEDATNYERFVGEQGLSWLDNRNVQTSDFRTIKIHFTYYRD